MLHKEKKLVQDENKRKFHSNSSFYLKENFDLVIFSYQISHVYNKSLLPSQINKILNSLYS